MAQVLVVEDAPRREAVAAAIVGAGHEVAVLTDPQQAVDLFATSRPTVCVIDVTMADRMGLQVLHAVRAIDPDVRVIAWTGDGDMSNVIDAVRGGAWDVASNLQGVQRALHRATGARDERGIAVV